MVEILVELEEERSGDVVGDGWMAPRFDVQFIESLGKYHKVRLLPSPLRYASVKWTSLILVLSVRFSSLLWVWLCPRPSEIDSKQGEPLNFRSVRVTLENKLGRSYFVTSLMLLETPLSGDGTRASTPDFAFATRLSLSLPVLVPSPFLTRLPRCANQSSERRACLCTVLLSPSLVISMTRWCLSQYL
jgi:hypothetical protein